jgi:hypothetical protein
MLKAFLERRAIKKMFGRYVSPELARQIIAGGIPKIPPPTERSIEFALIAVTAPDAPTFSECVAIVSQLVIQHGGFVQPLIPVAVVAFGSIGAASSGARLRFVSELRSRLPDVAIVHGATSAHGGAFGSAEHMEVGVWWPGMLDAFRLLATLSPGMVHELSPNERNE